MEEKIYALRNSSFWYDDEFFFNLMNSNDHIGHITAIFEDKEQAIQEWKRLEYEFSQQVDFYNILYCEPNFNIILDQNDFFANINSEDDWKRILPTAPAAVPSRRRPTSAVWGPTPRMSSGCSRGT